MRRFCLRSRRLTTRVCRTVVIGLVVTAVVTGCGGAQATPTAEPATPTAEPAGITVTFEGDECVYHGPERVPAGQIPVTLDVRDQSAREAYKVIAYTLDEGKTVEDLRAWKSVGHSPLWIRFHGMLDEPPGTLQERTIILFESPLFLACITDPPNYITDVLGPIEVVPPASK